MNSKTLTIPYKVQTGNKPKIEEVIEYCLDGNMKETALEFAVYMQDNEMPFKICTSTTRSQRAIYKGKVICQMQVYADNEYSASPKHNPNIPQHWKVTVFLWDLGQYEKSVVDDEMRYFIRENLSYCIECKKVCPRGRTLTILGKEIKNICRNRLCIEIKNPDKTAIYNIIQLIEFEKEAKKN